MKLKNVRAILFLTCALVFIFMFYMGGRAVLPPEQASALRTANDTLALTPSFWTLVMLILTNNAVFCLVATIPFWGVVQMMVGGYNTGMILASYVSSSVSSLQMFLNLMSFPTTWFEVIAYSLATSESMIFSSVLLISSFKSKTFIEFREMMKNESRIFLKVFVSSIVIIALSALIETLIIKG